MDTTSIGQQWAHGTPERAVADAFSAFRRRDVAALAAAATSASIRALAARVKRELDAEDSQPEGSSIGELTDSQAASILGRMVTSLPEVLTGSVRCLIAGHVLESRVFDATPDGQRMIWLHCRVTGAEDEWVAVDCDPEVHRDMANRDAGVAHVVVSAGIEVPGRGVVPLAAPLIATTQLVGGEWKLILDEWSALGLPGFRGMGFWIDPISTNQAVGAPNESLDVDRSTNADAK